MRLGLFGCLLTLVFTGSFPGLAEQPAGPATLENLAQPEKTQDAAADADNASTAGRPAGTLVRPKDGVQHPDLDKAWAVYEAAVDRAAEEIRAAVEKQFEKAAADGNLPGVKKWKALGEAFDEQGTVPAEKETEKIVKAATEAFAKASEDLRRAYEQTIKALTKQAVKDKAMVEEAEKVDAEWKSLTARAVLKPRPEKVGVRRDGLPLPGRYELIQQHDGHRLLFEVANDGTIAIHAYVDGNGKKFWDPNPKRRHMTLKDGLVCAKDLSHSTVEIQWDLKKGEANRSWTWKGKPGVCVCKVRASDWQQPD